MRKLILKIILIILLGLMFLFFYTKNSNRETIIKEDTKIASPIASTTESQTEDQKLSNREIAMVALLKNPDKFDKSTFKHEEYYLTSYNDSFYGDGPENRLGHKSGGIIVFKIEKGKPKIFWESVEEINNGFAYFKDINNDGIPEIVWDGYFGATGRNSAYYAYKFDGNKFTTITPVRISKGITMEGTPVEATDTLISGDSGLTYMEDLDNDGIQEFTTGYWDENNNAMVSTYKWNGTEYYLWKKEIDSTKHL